MTNEKNPKNQSVQELMKEVENWQQVFDANKTPTMLLNSAFEILKANRAMLSFLGKSADEVIGKACFQIVHEAKMPIEMCPLEKLKISKKSEELEIYSPEKDKHLVVTVDPCLDEKGNVTQIIHIIRDITDYKKTEDILRENEEKYRALFEAAGDAMFIMDVSEDFGARFIDCNERTLRLFSYRHRDQIIGKSPEDLSPKIQPDGQSSHEKIMKLARAVIRGNQQFFEWEHLRSDGAHFQVEVLLSPVKIRNKLCVQAVVRDITGRKIYQDAIKLSEIKFRELFNNMNSAVAIYEAKDGGNDFIIKDFNPTGEIIEKIKKEEILGKSITEVFPGVKEFGLFDVIRRVWETGRSEHFPAKIYKDYRIQGWRENYVFKLSSGEVVAIYDDVTERKRIEKEITNLSKFPDEIDNPVYRVSKDGVLLFANRASRELILEDQVKIGEKISEKWQSMIAKVYESGAKNTVELEFSGKVFLFDQIPVLEKGYVNVYGREITELKATANELHKKIRELEKFHKLAVDRELRMIELKKKISEFESGKKEK